MKALKQRKSEMKDGKCDVRAFENNSTVSVREPVAETEVSNKNTYDRQRPDTECTNDSVYLDTCLGSEIDPLGLVEAESKAFISSLESSTNVPSSIYYWNRSSEEKFHQGGSNDHQVIESTFSVGNCFGLYRVEKFGSGWNLQLLKYMIYSCTLSKDKSWISDHHLSTGWLSYSKRGVFGIDGSYDFESNLKSFESYHSGDHIKSNKIVIEHPRELVGQPSPFSSEDG
jgi:hypothetical protein